MVILLVKNYPQYKIVNFDKLEYCSSLKNLEEIETYPNYTFVKVCAPSALPPPSPASSTSPLKGTTPLCVPYPRAPMGGMARGRHTRVCTVSQPCVVIVSIAPPSLPFLLPRGTSPLATS